MKDQIEQTLADIRTLIRREIADHGLGSPVRKALGAAAAWLIDASGVAGARESGTEPPRAGELPWYADHGNLITLTRYMADTGASAGDVAYAVEKPWAHEDEWRDALAAAKADGAS